MPPCLRARTSALTALALGAAALAVLAGCQDSPSDDGAAEGCACLAGTSTPCTCTGGAEGLRRCAEDCSAWRSCDCGVDGDLARNAVLPGAPSVPCVELDCEDGDAGCVTRPRPDGTPCDDGDPCTVSDRCDDGLCAGQARACDDGDPCTAGSCDPETGWCAGSPLPDGTGCSDGDACTVGDVCDGGRCVPGPSAVCDDGDPCTADRCDPEDGTCAQPAAPDGTPCDDGDPCTVEDGCLVGACAPGRPMECTGPDPCQRYACTEGACAPAGAADDGAPCDDGDWCTAREACHAGDCTAVELRCDDGEPCTEDTCSAALRRCEHAAVVDGEACDDGLDCTDGEVCLGGLCLGEAPDCALHDPCAVGRCAGDDGACERVPVPAGVACCGGAEPAEAPPAGDEAGCDGGPAMVLGQPAPCLAPLASCHGLAVEIGGDGAAAVPVALAVRCTAPGQVRADLTLRAGAVVLGVQRATLTPEPDEGGDWLSPPVRVHLAADWEGSPVEAHLEAEVVDSEGFSARRDVRVVLGDAATPPPECPP